MRSCPAAAISPVGQRLGLAGGDVLAALTNVSNWWYLADGQSYGSLFDGPSPLLHFWSLAIEEQAYVVLPLLVVLAHTCRRAGRALGLIAASLAVGSFALPFVAGFSVDRTYYGTDSRLGEILVGVVLAAALAALVAMMATVDRGSSLITLGLLPLTAMLSVVVGVACHPGGLIARAGSLRPVRWCGQASYVIYLVHWRALGSVARSALRGCRLASSPAGRRSGSMR